MLRTGASAIAATEVVAGLSLKLSAAGSGRPLLFLHAGHGFEAGEYFELLAERFSLIAPSHPGFDGSGLPGTIDGVDDLAYLYLDLIKQRGLEDLVVVGVSLGAWIAAEIAVRSTERIGALVLASAVGAKFGPVTERDFVDVFSLDHAELSELVRHSQAEPKTVTSIEDARVIAANREAFWLYGWSPTLHNPKLALRLHRIDVPTLVLSGAEDRIVRSGYAERLAQAIPQARLETIPGAGHYLHMDQPSAFAAAVRRFAGN